MMNDTNPQNKQGSLEPKPGEWNLFTRQAAIVVLLIGVLALIRMMLPLLSLLAVTGIFVLVLSYPVNSLQKKRKMRYPVAVLVVFIPLAIIFILLVIFVFQWMVDSLNATVATLNVQLLAYQGVIDSFLNRFSGAGNAAMNSLSGILTAFREQIGAAAQCVSGLGIAFFLAFLFILEMPANLARSFESLSDYSQREFGILIDRLSNVWNGWLRSTVITSFLVGVTTAIELYIFGIPYAGILGVIAGFLNLIPTFGPLIAYLLIIVVTYTQGSTRLDLNSTTLTLLVWIINMLINQFIRLVIFPRLAGKAVRLPVFLVILGLVVAAVLWGVIGVILVIPLMGTVREVFFYVMRKINRQEPYPDEVLKEGFWLKEITSK
jgi:predicted PurR-regulated permease PerM